MANDTLPQFDPTLVNFKMNQYYDIDGQNEANLYNGIFEESTYLFGDDIVYIERTVGNVEPIFGEYLASVLTQGTPFRMFMEEKTGFSGNGDMYSKFGLQITDESTFHCPVSTFNRGKGATDPTNFFYPKVGDLIYFMKGKKLFEITHIENEQNPGFYAFGNRNAYIFKCKTYSYSNIEVAENDSIPAEIQALNGINLKDEENHNGKIQQVIADNPIIDNTEVDPLRR